MWVGGREEVEVYECFEEMNILLAPNKKTN